MTDNETYDHTPVRDTKLIADIYVRCNLAILEPARYEEAAKDPKGIDAMKKELWMIEKKQTWVLVDKPDHKKPIGIKWVYKTILNSDESIKKYKVRLVVKGYTQQYVVDF
jgi:hypothetical protein